MRTVSGNPTVQRREEKLLRERLAAMDGKMDAVAKMMQAGTAMGAGAVAPAFSDADVAEVGKLLVEGRMWLPKYARVTVTTEIETIKSKVFGTSEVFTHTADQLCCHQLQPMSIPAALEAGLVSKLSGSWRWRGDVYRRLVPPDPRLIP
jgi:hypothetical protein